MTAQFPADVRQTSLRQARIYANALRNKAKRTYANQYIDWATGGYTGLEPDRGSLTYMAAQAVRWAVKYKFGGE